MIRSKFFIIMPLLLLLAGGIFLKTIQRSVPFVASITNDFSGEFKEDELEGVYYGKLVYSPGLLTDEDSVSSVLGVANPEEKWIEVDLSEQKVRAWDGNSLFVESLVSTGLPWWPTPEGEFRIWVKVRATRMEGGEGRYYYNLPNVPYVMFFGNSAVPNWRGFSLHGTYWHSDFGKPHSHGCVNLPTPIAEKLYYWTTPTLTEGKGTTFASSGNPGTRIIIHE
jgi:hypothetical protein